MRSGEMRIGTMVRVRPSYRKSELRGAVGTIAKIWGAPHYGVVEVHLDGRKLELFWRHEVEKIGEEAQEGTFAQLRWG